MFVFLGVAPPKEIVRVADPGELVRNAFMKRFENNGRPALLLIHGRFSRRARSALAKGRPPPSGHCLPARHQGTNASFFTPFLRPQFPFISAAFAGPRPSFSRSEG